MKKMKQVMIDLHGQLEIDKPNGEPLKKEEIEEMNILELKETLIGITEAL